MFEDFDCGEEFDSLDDSDIALLKSDADENEMENLDSD